MDIDIAISRHLLGALRLEFARKGLAKVRLMKDAWVWHFHRDHWEFHGPDKFYWHGRAHNAYDARYKGWSAWLNANAPGLNKSGRDGKRAVDNQPDGRKSCIKRQR